MAISYIEQFDVTYNSGQEPGKASLQYVSGWMFSSLGLRPQSSKPRNNLRTADALHAGADVKAQATRSITNDPVFKRVAFFETLVLG